jgi:hypothetical protein
VLVLRAALAAGDSIVAWASLSPEGNMSMAKYYEILITHTAGEPCPALPEGLEGLEYKPASEYDSWQCPTHLVFQAACPIWKARQVIEKHLFYAKGIERISLYYGGDRKEKDCYERDRLRSRRWNRI